MAATLEWCVTSDPGVPDGKVSDVTRTASISGAISQDGTCVAELRRGKGKSLQVQAQEKTPA